MPNPGPFWSHIFRLRFLITLLVIGLLTTVLSHMTPFQQLSNFGLDLWQNLGPKHQTEWCRLVAITDTEYRDKFHGQSPLNPEVLADAINALLRYEPAVLGIDIDTSHEQFSAIKRPSHPTIPIVWARDGDVESEEPLSVRPLPIWGRSDEEPEYSGLALLPSDLDGLIRGYRRTWTWGTKPVDSFHWAVVKAYCATRNAPGCADVGNENRTNELFSTPARERNDLRPAPLSDFWRPQAAISDRNILKGKVVILGGIFQAARDEHSTPLGPRYGLEIIGNAIESDLANDKVNKPSAWLKYFWKILLALVLAASYHFLTPRWALATTSGLLCTIIVLGSLSAFLFGAYWADYVPLLLGVWIEQLYEQAEKAQVYYDQRAGSPKSGRRSHK